MSDFEMGASKGKQAAIAHALATELRSKTVGQIVDSVDQYYKENPSKLSTTVLEVILMRCTTVCPPGMAGVKK